ncbi:MULTISPECIES: xanthine dehydrogenase FAD-binding subunit XdhB [Desulfosporosinus]|uniref:xanthine dehydrogenase FAD-binding subunit XdhB n=1 Tax=Desulfosporosinus TaxID=79206 RepID=UPI00207C14E9|nr:MULTISPECIES: xanthine dehydrogenase FAD-binding subunit XdhB [Desulfosporosinus]MCO1603923.1 xanthine dehydrogenase FAD-binding subunit XdhB [Desulfosporosinus nitroreducens]MCO5387612.1 xanthine dehydrogenase FAD-binding subunit XdhB [Desulfosporosinus sp.]MDA8223455.1 xanthine dehydrogenase FAD-binding subunit XdhB [Desulfitobacterium hafniense]
MYDIKGYYDAETVSEATALLADNPNMKLIAGGTDVLIKMHGGQLEDAELLSLRKIKSLESISVAEDGTIVIGAMATFSMIFHNPMLKDLIPILTEAAISMGGPQIRNIATIGGNVCNGATSADSASSLFALNAHLKLQDKNGERVVPIREFYLGPGKVALNPGEILTEILIAPEDYKGFGGQYIKFAMREAMDIATLGVAVVCKVQSGNFDEVRIGLGVAGPTPLRCLEAEEYAKGKKITSETLAEIGKLAVKSAKARTSWRASKEYREHLVEELTQRALKIAVVNAGGAEVV